MSPLPINEHRGVWLAFRALITIALIASSPSCRKSDYILDEVESVTDQGGGTGTTTWTRDRHYILDGLVFVNDGQTLTIEAGTVIRAKTGQGSLASALIVARGGTIIAEGERTLPIIFTVEGDDLKGSVPVEARGLWGGVVILGNAKVNTESGEDMIEGIPISEPRGIYGGPDDADNSGILRFVSIRHGGTDIGEGNEINGLTLGGVGSQTIIENIEVISNNDDGVEFFGGDANCKNLAVSFCGDDGFDMDQGFHGHGQFWLCIGNEASDKCLEITGGTQPFPALPGNLPLIYNTTLIGSQSSGSEPMVIFLDYGAGFIRNSIFLHPGEGIAIKYTDRQGDSYASFEASRLAVDHNIFFPAEDPVPRFYTFSDLGENLDEQNLIMADSLAAWMTDYTDPGISSDNGYTLLPPSTVFPMMAPYPDPWFEGVTYKGAFGSTLWIEGWTLLFESGYINH